MIADCKIHVFYCTYIGAYRCAYRFACRFPSLFLLFFSRSAVFCRSCRVFPLSTKIKAVVADASSFFEEALRDGGGRARHPDTAIVEEFDLFVKVCVCVGGGGCFGDPQDGFVLQIWARRKAATAESSSSVYGM